MRSPWLLLLLLLACRTSLPRPVEVTPTAGDGPRVLCIVAHPDDEIAFAGTLYKTATFLNGTCDLAVITNGEGGFKYATLAERVYGLELTDEAVGRAELPAIRRRELAAGCKWLGVRRITFLDQRDHRYTQDPEEVLGPDGAWDVTRVAEVLDELLRDGDYDFVLTLAPTPTTHGHHQAATLLALAAVARSAPEDRPVILCARTTGRDEVPEPPGLPDRPETAVIPDPTYLFDRTQAFGHRDRLDYTIVADWAIAEHKSQGTMQRLVGKGEHETYFLFTENRRGAGELARAWFARLAEPQFQPRTYGPSAGTNAGNR